MILLKLLGTVILFIVIFVLMMILVAGFSFWGLFRQLTGRGNGRQPFGNQQNPFGGQQNPFGNQQNNPFGNQQQRPGGQQQDQWYRPNSQQSRQQSSSTSSSTAETTVTGAPRPRNSVIDKNEGEYVDFEEL